MGRTRRPAGSERVAQSALLSGPPGRVSGFSLSIPGPPPAPAPEPSLSWPCTCPACRRTGPRGHQREPRPALPGAPTAARLSGVGGTEPWGALGGPEPWLPARGLRRELALGPPPQPPAVPAVSPALAGRLPCSLSPMPRPEDTATYPFPGAPGGDMESCLGFVVLRPHPAPSEGRSGSPWPGW